MRVTAVAIALIIVLGCFVWVMVDAAMPSNSALTVMRMKRLAAVAAESAKKNNLAPETLAGLTMGEGGAVPTQDYWGRPLMYAANATGTSVEIRIESLGKDGKAGGTREDRDLVVTEAVELSPATDAATRPATKDATTLPSAAP